MRYSPLKLFAGCFLMVAITPSYAASAVADFQKAMAEGTVTHVLDIDNDSLLLQRDDKFYSGALRYSRQYSIPEEGRTTSYGWRLGQDMYTASSTKLQPAEIGPNDHPYAAWLYGGLFKETAHADGRHLKVGLDFGCLGPCAGGEWTQKNVHRLLNQRLPQGWSTQVRNEWGAVLYGDIAFSRWTPASWIDLTPSLQARFGNIHTDATGGATLRFGSLNTLPDQATLHGFFRADARAVAYNASLEGGYFSNNNPHTVKPKSLVGEVEFGIAWNSKPLSIKASIVRRGNEIADLSNSIGAQNFARIQFTYLPE